MCKPKAIEDISVDDLKAHRWCFYQNDDEGIDAFEYIIPDNHPEFSEHIVEIELSVFEFLNSKVVFGFYDGSEAFNIISGDEWYSFWYGVAEPSQEDLDRFKLFIECNGLELPVLATAKWSGTTRTYGGIQYINRSGETIEKAI
ncbi:hypothetical protein KO489_12545 [Reinekea forsetii]|nr:hypothetical protein [Reinekea forsetii]